MFRTAFNCCFDKGAKPQDYVFLKQDCEVIRNTAQTTVTGAAPIKHCERGEQNKVTTRNASDLQASVSYR